MRNLWWKEENWPTLKKAMEIRRNPAFNEVCDEGPVTRLTVTIFLQRIGSKTVTFDHSFLPRKQALLFQIQVNDVEDIIVTRNTANLGMSRKEVIHMISDTVQVSSYFQA